MSWHCKSHILALYRDMSEKEVNASSLPAYPLLDCEGAGEVELEFFLPNVIYVYMIYISYVCILLLSSDISFSYS